jgi:hypothetical protein
MGVRGQISNNGLHLICSPPCLSGNTLSPQIGSRAHYHWQRKGALVMVPASTKHILSLNSAGTRDHFLAQALQHGLGHIVLLCYALDSSTSLLNSTSQERHNPWVSLGEADRSKSRNFPTASPTPSQSLPTRILPHHAQTETYLPLIERLLSWMRKGLPFSRQRFNVMASLLSRTVIRITALDLMSHFCWQQ